jgi:hypothetical protein
MSDTRAKLWTIAHRDFVESARAKGSAHGSWEYVEPRWRPAYRWMIERLRDRGLIDSENPADSPPIWAWHSCGGWQHPPTSESIDLLLGIEPHNREGLYMVSWNAPVERILLSCYAPWCDLLDRVVAGSNPVGMGKNILLPPLTTNAPPPGWTPDDELQACVHVIYWKDIESVQPLSALARMPLKRSP